MSKQPTHIEIAVPDLIDPDSDIFIDDDSYTCTEECEDFTHHLDDEEDDVTVTHQDLDALAGMVQEMRENPILLQESPRSSMVPDSQAPSSPTNIAISLSSQIHEQGLPNQPFTRRNYVDLSFLCRENDSITSMYSPKEQVRSLSLPREAVVLPFQD